MLYAADRHHFGDLYDAVYRGGRRSLVVCGKEVRTRSSTSE